MLAREIMTRDVISVRPHTSVRDIAALMAEKHISGVPVLTDDGKIVGIVSESDLLHRAEVGTERRRKWWFRHFGDPNVQAQDYAKAHGLAAHDVMSRYVISVRGDAELRDVADILDRRRVKRVPVIEGDSLAGIITRGDLVRALSEANITKAVTKPANAGLHAALHDLIRGQSWVDSSYISVTVNDGVVEIWGFVDTVDQRNALCALIEQTEGVSRVEDHLTIGIPFLGAIG